MSTKHSTKLVMLCLLIIGVFIHPYIQGYYSHTNTNLKISMPIQQIIEAENPAVNSLDIWKHYFNTNSKFYIYYSKKCKWINYVTFKTASFTTRDLFQSVKRCNPINCHRDGTGPEYRRYNVCKRNKTLSMMQRFEKQMIFIRHPVSRFVSLYNFIYKEITSLHGFKTFDEKNISLPLLEVPLFFDFLYSFLNNSWKHNNTYIKYILEHFQPLSLYLCTKYNNISICGIPSFVGKVETLHNDITYLYETNYLKGHWNLKHILNESHPTKTHFIDIFDVYNNTQLLINVCKLYWNDFVCGAYEIPKECMAMNEEIWAYDLQCRDVTDKIVEWNTYIDS